MPIGCRKRVYVVLILLVSTLVGTASAPSFLPNSVFPGAAPKYIVTIVLENHPMNGTYGVVNSRFAPYIYSLAHNYSYAENYLDVADFGSLPNYLGLVGGGVPCSDVDPAQCQITGPNIIDRIEASGRAWKAFMEDYKDCATSSDKQDCNTAGCFTGPYQAGYLDNHNPFLYFQDIVNSNVRCANIQPANSQILELHQFGTYPDLFVNELYSANPANYIFLVPNHCDSMHGPFDTWMCYPDPNKCSTTDNLCLLKSQLQMGDAYLKHVVPKILSSPIANQMVLFITWDESYTHPAPPDATCPNPSPNPPVGSGACQDAAIWIGPHVKKGFVSNIQYTHYSALKTVETAWSLQPLTSNDANASPMTEFFVAWSVSGSGGGRAPMPLAIGSLLAAYEARKQY